MKLFNRNIRIWFILISFYVLALSPLVLAQDKQIQFPQDYLGKYEGTLHINSERGNQNIPMEFHLLATDSVGKYRYTLIYGAGERKQERAYTLIEKNKEKGEFVVDENNGIVLDDKVIENRMYALFEVNGTLLTTFITFHADHLIFEIIAAPIAQKRLSYSENEPKTEVISYPVAAVQRAVLQKQ